MNWEQNKSDVRLSPAEGADEETPPSEVWRKWKQAKDTGNYHHMRGLGVWSDVQHADDPVRYAQYHGPLPVRIGSYGDPAAVPTRVWAELVRYAKNWMGYTHMWKPRYEHERCMCCDDGYDDCTCTCTEPPIWEPDPDLKRYCMASVDTPEERAEAQALGWRTFFVVPEAESRYYPTLNMLNERQDILCPATDPKRGKVCRHCDGEGWMDIGPDDEDGNLTIETCIECNGAGRVSTTCAVCGLCRGTSANCPSIWEIAHGKNKENHKW